MELDVLGGFEVDPARERDLDDVVRLLEAADQALDLPTEPMREELLWTWHLPTTNLDRDTRISDMSAYHLREHRQDGDVFSGVVEHHLQAASDPELLEEDPSRPFTVSGDRLVLGDGKTWRRLFERVV